MATGLSSALQQTTALQPAWRPEEIPPFPAVALKALNLMAGKDTSLIELCNLIRPDAAFSTEVLRIANSPLVAFSKDVTSVVQASILLGFGRLRRVVITVGLRAYLTESFTPLLQSCWRHSLASALLAERAAKTCGLDKDTAYTAGIMHDIGRVVLAVSMPHKYSRITEQPADCPRDLLQKERELFGIDHCQAGVTLVDTWKLPQYLSSITGCHHNPDARAGMESIMSHACLLADLLGFGVASFGDSVDYTKIISAFPEVGRGGFPDEAATLTAELTEQIMLIESV
jgi:putative nucleotidyltransferase with HDIG domain